MRKLRTIELQRISIDDFKKARKIPLTVVLDDVRSLHNVGSVFRSSDAFRIEAIYLCGITACPPHAEIHKTALGAEDSVTWEYFSDTKDAIARLHQKGCYVYAIEQVENACQLQHIDLEAAQEVAPSFAVVFGNEVKGVKQEVVDVCDDCLEIPQFGTKHSLNVSVAAGIVIWEFARQLLLDTQTR